MLKWLPSLIAMSGIFYLSSRTSSELTIMFPFFTNLNWGHLVAYFILALTYVYPLNAKYSLKKSIILSILFSILYGLTDEWHQMYVDGRSPDFNDIANDTIGASIAMVIYYFWQKITKYN